MSLPLKESLALVEPHLPRPLVPEATWPAIRRVAGGLPDVSSTFYLERHLGAGGERVDFLACVAAEAGAPERLSAWCSERGWERLHRFAEEWARPGTLLHRQVPFIWLELDAPSEQPLAAPNLLLCTDPTPLERHRGHRPEWDGRPEVHQQVIERAAEVLLGAPIPLDTLRTCYACLPPGGNILHLSIMSARNPVALKLNVSLPRRELSRYLAEIGWPGDSAALAADLERFAPGQDPVRLDLTAGASISPRVGLELFRAGDRRLRDALFDQCLTSGLCTPEQREALRLWPGSSRERRPDGTWPARVNRWTDAKVVYQGNALAAAKAYLGVSAHFSLV